MCLLLAVSVMFGFFGLLGPPGSGRDGREWESGKCAMFCWRLWAEGLKEQLCRESQHPALNCSSPVNIEVIIEDVFWPLKPAVLSESHSAQCLLLLSFAGHKKKIMSYFVIFVYSTIIVPWTTYQWYSYSVFCPTIVAFSFSVASYQGTNRAREI